MTNLEVAAVELNRARRELDRKRGALAESRKVLNARLAHLERVIRGERRSRRAA
jgi:hypothetical protein